MKNLLLVLATCLATTAFGQDPVTVTIVPTAGDWASEASWDIVNPSDSSVVAIGDLSANVSVDVPAGQYLINQYDSFGDGWNGGSINVQVGTTTLFLNLTNGELRVTLVEVSADAVEVVPACFDETACNYEAQEECVYAAPATNCDGTPIDAIVLDCNDEFGWLDVVDITNESVDSLGNVSFGTDFQNFILSADGTTLDAAAAGLFYFNGEGFVGECGSGYEGCLLTISGYDGELNVYVSPEEQELLDIIDGLTATNDSLAAANDSLTTALQDCSVDAADAYANGYDYGYEAGYNAGLEDCEGEPSGLVDIDGNTIIEIVGYYNELGQVIDPRRTNGLIIRRHADGTFSKYIKQLR